MAQSANSPDQALKEILIKSDGEAGNESQSQQQQIDLPILGASMEGASTGTPEPTRRRNEELSDPKKGSASGEYRGGGGGEDEDVEVMDCTSNATFRRNSTTFISRTKTKTRQEDANWMYDRMSKLNNSTKKDDDWFLDEYIHPKKLSLLMKVQWVGLVLILSALACTLSMAQLKEKTLLDLQLWKWEVLIFVIICGQLLSHWGVRVIVFFVESNLRLKMRVLYFLYGMRNAVQNCIWFGLILIAWRYVVAENIEMNGKISVLPYVTKILMCLFVSTLIWLVKTLTVKALASSFHVSAFFDRIKVSLFKQYVIKKLNEEQSDTPKRYCESYIIDCLQRLNKKNVSAWRMKRLISLVHDGFKFYLSNGDEDEDKDPQELFEEDQSLLCTRDERHATVLAKKIFPIVARPGCSTSVKSYIYPDDLKRFIRQDKVSQVMKLFEGSMERERMSEQSFITWMVEAFRERRTLLWSLDDTKTAVDDLDNMLDVIVAIIIVIIWLLIFGVATTHFLLLISSQVLLAGFIFGNSCKTTFEAIIFLFIMHPYDVGDRCEVDGVQMVVDEMNILTTVFLRYDQQKIVYPNSVLASKPIGNYFRSPAMGDTVEFSVHISTPREKIEEMKSKIKEYIMSTDDHWQGDPMIFVKDVEDMNRLAMAVWVRHTINHNDVVKRWNRRASLIENMIQVFRELEIEYRMLPIDLNVRNMPGLTSTRLPSNWITCAG